MGRYTISSNIIQYFYRALISTTGGLLSAERHNQNIPPVKGLVPKYLMLVLLSNLPVGAEVRQFREIPKIFFGKNLNVLANYLQTIGQFQEQTKALASYYFVFDLSPKKDLSLLVKSAAYPLDEPITMATWLPPLSSKDKMQEKAAAEQKPEKLTNCCLN